MNFLKRIFNLSITLALVGVLVTSCEREIIIEEDVNGANQINEDIKPPLTMEELDELFLKNNDFFTEVTSANKNQNCGCSHLGTSYRSSDTRYVYCYNWNKNNRSGNVFFKAQGYFYINATYTYTYYAHFKDLIPGKEYRYFAELDCTDGSVYRSNDIYWTQ